MGHATGRSSPVACAASPAPDHARRQGARQCNAQSRTDEGHGTTIRPCRHVGNEPAPAIGELEPATAQTQDRGGGPRPGRLRPAPEFGCHDRRLPRTGSVALHLGDVALVKCEPAVIGPASSGSSRRRARRASRRPPPRRRGSRARRQRARRPCERLLPNRPSAGTGGRRGPAFEHGLGIVEPPRRPAQVLERLGRLLVGKSVLEERLRRAPAPVPKHGPTGAHAIGGNPLRGRHDSCNRSRMLGLRAVDDSATIAASTGRHRDGGV